MSKNKLVACRHCGATIARTAKACPHCGGKNKKSILKRFIRFIFSLLLIIVLLVAGFLTWNYYSVQNRNAQRRQSALDLNKIVETASPIDEAETQTGSVSEPTPKSSADPTAKPTVKPTAKPTAEPAVEASLDKDGVSLEFKEKMDKLEEFFDEYAAFMVKYSKSDNAISMLLDYTSYMTKYVEAMNALDSIDESKLSKADDKYYTKVLIRINAKIAEAAVSMD